MSLGGRRYLSELFGAIGLYAVALVASLWLLRLYPQSDWRVLIALLPMAPALLLPLVIARHLQRLDELQRRLQLEALSFAFASTAILTFGYGFLEIVDFPRLSAFMVWPLMAVLWVIGLWLANRRMR